MTINSWLLSSGLPCDIFTRDGNVVFTQTSIGCLTPPLNLTESSHRDLVNQSLVIRVHIAVGGDLLTIQNDDVTFTYMPDPNVTDIQPLNSFLRY